METEILAVSLRQKNGKYTAIKNQKGEKVGEEMHVGLHLENVLNHFGKEGWVLEQVNADETELHFSRKKMFWLKRLFEPKVKYRIRNIYEENGKYEVGGDLPFGEISSFEGLYLNSMKEVANYLTSKYKMTLLFQSFGEKLGDNTLIKLYFRMSQ